MRPAQRLLDRMLLLGDDKSGVGKVEQRLVQRSVRDPLENLLLPLGAVENIDDPGEPAKLVETAILQELGESGSFSLSASRRLYFCLKSSQAA